MPMTNLINVCAQCGQTGRNADKIPCHTSEVNYVRMVLHSALVPARHRDLCPRAPSHALHPPSPLHGASHRRVFTAPGIITALHTAIMATTTTTTAVDCKTLFYIVALLRAMVQV